MFTPIDQAIEHFKQNKFVIVMDDAGRENEGDLICAAENVSTEQMAFLVRHSSGYVCAPMTNAIADKLDLPLLRTGMKFESNDDDRHGTAYTITVDVAQGTTTGISAHDRSMTCRALADSSSTPKSFLKPGHICPLRAADGGVLQRRGHTEAGVDLCKLSGLSPVAVIGELVNDDEQGTMMRLNDCQAIFGYGNKKSHDQLLQEANQSMNQAQQSLSNRISQLDTQIAQLNFQLQNIQKNLQRSNNKQPSLRKQALKILNKRKQLENMKDSLDSQSWSMTQAQLTNDNLQNTMITINALKQTNNAMKAQYGKINIDKLQDMQDEMLDLIEQGDELQEVLAMNNNSGELDDISDAELDAELDALAQEDFTLPTSENSLGNDMPSYLLGANAPPAFIDEEPNLDTEDKNKALESAQ
ncbi:Vacuolar protein-sorting-associated protein 60 [Saccharomyces cerevisiae]|nr:Vacuolar protein-sorting-associated protein 60 [Saccharomyces cerevisiae]